MTEQKLPNYDDFELFLHKNELPCTAAEIHAIISGCLCAGMPYKQADWRKFVSEFAMQNTEIADDVLVQFTELYKVIYQQLSDSDYSFELYIPTEDDIPLTEKAEVLVEWLAAFVAAFGAVVGEKFNQVDAQVKEAYQDLIEISQMDSEMDDSEENQISFEEITEYVRMTAITCFGELGDHSGSEDYKKPTFH